MITGVGTAAKRQADNVSAFTKSVRELANIAIPALSEMEKAEKAYSDALRNATTREERDDAYRAFQAAQERIRVAQTIPTPGQRPNPESFAPERERRAGGTRSKKVKDSFDELDDIVAKYVRDVVKAESGGAPMRRTHFPPQPASASSSKALGLICSRRISLTAPRICRSDHPCAAQ
ncbi:hypothetical protein HED54_14915 [Ochrobactrum anthropi ATCC 49188]|nr:hypothetical protein [Brucella anthropi ATCC 49188]